MAEGRECRWLRWLTGLPVALAVSLIRLYQVSVSPLLGRRCRFYPSCSEYAIEALRRKGLLVGSAKALWRLMRCHPFNPGGYDPVEKEEASGSGTCDGDER